jgi:hypothetical protein
VKSFTIIFILAVAFSACKNAEHEKQMEEINNLRAKIAKTDSLLKNVDAEAAERLETEVKNNSQFIQFNINKIADTIDFKTALFLSSYKMVDDAFDGLTINHKRIKIALDSTSRNLDNLEHDINNNSLAKGLTPENCIEQESEHVDEMYDFASKLRSVFDRAKIGYDTLTPKVNAYMKLQNQRLIEKYGQPDTK